MGYNLTGLLGFFIALFCLRQSDLPLTPLSKSCILLLATALPLIFCETLLAKSFLNPSSGLKPSGGTLHFSRVATKLFGFYTIIATLALMYFLFPEYQADFYTPYYRLLTFFLPVVLILAVPYFFIVDTMMKDPHDMYWKLGRALLRKGDFTYETLQLFLGWLVKAFFLPLMFVYFTRDTQFLTNFNKNTVFSSFSNFFEFTNHLIFSIDLLIVSIGYMCTLRIFDTHIRSTEPTFLGWGVALFCYQPFWSFFSSNYLSYDKNAKQWGYWLSDTPIYTLWGSCILALLGIYLWATVSFGLRFSNLTHRGIITNGPYRFTKHPAYVSKNLAWWMMSMPFMLSVSYIESFRHCLMLAMLNLIYFARAKTEERHLSQDPVYRDYADYIRLHGVFSLRRQSTLSSPLLQKSN
jgi:protein-S-isoprenylcysteine O-methyltransferase Ste14